MWAAGLEGAGLEGQPDDSLLPGPFPAFTLLCLDFVFVSVAALVLIACRLDRISV